MPKPAALTGDILILQIRINFEKLWLSVMKFKLHALRLKQRHFILTESAEQCKQMTLRQNLRISNWYLFFRCPGLLYEDSTTYCLFVTCRLIGI